MNEWSKESLKEMFGDNVIEKLAFLSGCTKHSYCDPSHRNLDGYIVSYEKLEKFAEFIVNECCFTGEQYANGLIDPNHYTFVNKKIKEHFGVK